jgi:Flp pilus assembly protein TadB
MSAKLKCHTCGGNLLPQFDGKYKCSHCKGVRSGTEAEAKRKADRELLARLEAPVVKKQEAKPQPTPRAEDKTETAQPVDDLDTSLLDDLDTSLPTPKLLKKYREKLPTLKIKYGVYWASLAAFFVFAFLLMLNAVVPLSMPSIAVVLQTFAAAFALLLPAHYSGAVFARRSTEKKDLAPAFATNCFPCRGIVLIYRRNAFRRDRI